MTPEPDGQPEVTPRRAAAPATRERAQKQLIGRIAYWMRVTGRTKPIEIKTLEVFANRGWTPAPNLVLDVFSDCTDPFAYLRWATAIESGVFKPERARDQAFAGLKKRPSRQRGEGKAIARGPSEPQRSQRALRSVEPSAPALKEQADIGSVLAKPQRLWTSELLLQAGLEWMLGNSTSHPPSASTRYGMFKRDEFCDPADLNQFFGFGDSDGSLEYTKALLEFRKTRLLPDNHEIEPDSNSTETVDRSNEANNVVLLLRWTQESAVRAITKKADAHARLHGSFSKRRLLQFIEDDTELPSLTELTELFDSDGSVKPLDSFISNFARSLGLSSGGLEARSSLA